MTDYLVQFELDKNTDHLILAIDDYDLDVTEIEEICEEYICDRLEVCSGDIYIYDIQPLNREVDIENLLEVSNG